MQTETRKFPANLKATIEDKINQLTQAIPILKDHLKQFGPQIQRENPMAHLTITEGIQLLERELELRLFTKNFTNLHKSIKLSQKRGN